MYCFKYIYLEIGMVEKYKLSNQFLKSIEQIHRTKRKAVSTGKREPKEAENRAKKP